MAYRIEHDESVGDAVRRIAAEQLDDAIDDLDDGMTDDPTEAVHDCRKRCKKVRGLVRLVRPALADGAYRDVNDRARDAARLLSPLRDASATHETFLTLRACTGAGDDAADVVEEILAARREAVEAELAGTNSAVVRAAAELEALRKRIDDVALDDEGWDAIEDGLAKTYGRGRDAFEAVLDAPSGENFHEWRKRAKYTWYHVRLLRDAAPSVLGPLEQRFHDLSDALGDAHDMVVLAGWLESDDPVVERLPDVTPVMVMIDGARGALERRATTLGSRLYAESPKRFRKRLGAYWEAWHEHGDESATGELDVVLAGAG